MPTPYDILGNDTINSMLEQGLSKDDIRKIAQQEYNIQKNPYITNEKHEEFVDKFNTRAGRGWQGIKKAVTLEGLYMWNRLFDEGAGNMQHSDVTKDLRNRINAYEFAKGEWEQRSGKSATAASVGEFVGGFVDPVNAIGSGSPSLIKRVAINFFAGATSGAGYAWAMDQDASGMAMSAAFSGVGGAAAGELFRGAWIGIQKLRGKSLDSSLPNLSPEEKNKILQDAAANDPLFSQNGIKVGDEGVSAENIVDSVLVGYDQNVKSQVITDLESGNPSSIIDQEIYDGLKTHKAELDNAVLYDKELTNIRQQLESAADESINGYSKDIELRAQYMEKYPNFTEQQIAQLINANNKPTPNMLQTSLWLNDGAPVDPRASGTKILSMLENEIQYSTRTPEELGARLKELGFGDEQINAFVDAYAKKDIGIARKYFDEKVSNKAADEAIARTNKAAHGQAKKTKEKQKQQNQAKQQPITQPDNPLKFKEYLVLRDGKTYDLNTQKGRQAYAEVGGYIDDLPKIPDAEPKTSEPQPKGQIKFFTSRRDVNDKASLALAEGERIKFDVEGFKDVDFAIEKTLDYYTISDIKTGLKLESGKTKKEAIQKASELLQKTGRNKYDNAVKENAIDDIDTLLKEANNPNAKIMKDSDAIDDLLKNDELFKRSYEDMNYAKELLDSGKITSPDEIKKLKADYNTHKKFVDGEIRDKRLNLETNEVLSKTAKNKTDKTPKSEPSAKPKKELPPMPKTKKEFEQWAKDNKVPYDTKGSDGVQIQKGKVYAAYDEVKLNDSKDGVKLFKDITDTKEGKKILELQDIVNISKKGDIIKADSKSYQYTKEHGHPFDDKELQKLFRDSGDIMKLYKIGSYIDDHYRISKLTNQDAKKVAKVSDPIKKQKLQRTLEREKLFNDYVALQKEASRLNSQRPLNKKANDLAKIDRDIAQNNTKLKGVENRLNKFERTKVDEDGNIVSDFEEICKR
jgi:hypothetical protein